MLLAVWAEADDCGGEEEEEEETAAELEELESEPEVGLGEGETYEDEGFAELEEPGLDV